MGICGPAAVMTKMGKGGETFSFIEASSTNVKLRRDDWEGVSVMGAAHDLTRADQKLFCTRRLKLLIDSSFPWYAKCHQRFLFIFVF